MPTVSGARPSMCPCCLSPSAPLGTPLVVVGHGVRGRVVWGPPQINEVALAAKVTQRRYRCRACRAVIVVRPRGIANHVRYSATAIALALFRWAHEGLAGHEVARQVSPQADRLYTRQHGWRQLCRWSKGANRIWLRLRPVTVVTTLEVATAVITQLAAHRQNGATSKLAQVWDGAHHA